MKIQTCLLIVAAQFSTPALSAQSVAPSLMAAGGDYFHPPGQPSLHWTLGEPAVESFDGLTLGFLQGAPAAVGTNQTGGAPDLVRVFPNPGSGWLQVEKSTAQPVRLQLTDAAGRLVFAAELVDFQTTIDFSTSPSGVYFLQILSENTFLLTDLILKI